MSAPRCRRLARGSWLSALGLVLTLVSTASAQAPNWPIEGPPRPLPQRTVQFPPYEIRTLPNGLQVITVLHHEQPAVSMRLIVRAGSTHDPRGKIGVSSLAATLLNQGTATRSAAQIADQIDQIGAAMATGSGPDNTFINMIVMKDSFGFGMDMIADLARNPVFAQEEIDRQKQQVLSALQVSVEDPAYVASTLVDRLIYGFHPYGMPPNGTPETIAAITRQDLQAYHRSYFAPNNMVLAIVGDVTSEEAVATAQRAFGQWPRAEVPAVQPIEPPPPTRRIVIVDKPDSVQTTIRIGQLTLPRKHPDFLALDLGVKVLGGEGGNRLFRILRSERGLTYGASAETNAWKTAGDVVAETDTRTEATGEALRLTVDEFSRLQRDAVSARELLNAQSYQAGSFPLTIETPNEIATQVLAVVVNELPIEDIGTFPQRVLAVSREDIQRVAREYIRPDRLSIVLVGNAAAFVNQLRQVGFTDFEVIPIDELDVMSATLRRERPRAAAGQPRIVLASAIQAAPPQAPRNDPAATALLNRIIEARGGLQALKGVRTVVADTETALRMEQGTLLTTTKTFVAYPDKFRIDANIQGIETTQVFNAGAAWIKSPAGVQDAPQGMRDEMAASVRRDIIPMLIAAADGRYTLRLLPDETRDGMRFRVLEVSGDELPPVRLYVDQMNFLARQSFSVAGPDGRPETAEEVFSDYRAVTGVQVPFRANVIRRGTVILSRAITNVTLNSPLDDQLFARP